jgi:hypothetical protein
MTLTDQGSTSDKLVAASSPVAQKVELHVFYVESGVYGMHQVDAIAITPGAASTVLRPGGAHVILESLTRSLRAGTTFPLTLNFQNAGALTLEVPVESPQAVEADATDWQASKAARGLFLKVGKKSSVRREVTKSMTVAPHTAAAVTLTLRLPSYRLRRPSFMRAKAGFWRKPCSLSV